MIAKKRKLVGFIGKRFIISKGLPEEISVAVIGDRAFVLPKTRRLGRSGGRADIIPVDRLFPTQKAAVEALKPKAGWAVSHRDIIPVKVVVDSDGDRAAYTIKDGARLWTGSNTVFTTKKLAANFALKEARKRMNLEYKDYKDCKNSYQKLVQKIKKMK